MRKIIYINGDSWAASRAFRTACYEQFHNDYLIINNSADGAWNGLITKTTINDVVQLHQLNKSVKIYAFIFYSECLRSETEFTHLKFLANKNNYTSINDLLAASLNSQYQLVKKNLNLANVQLHQTTAYISTADSDGPSMSDLIKKYYEIPINNQPCYAISPMIKHDNQQLIDLGFDKNQIIELIDSSITAIDQLNLIPNIDELHLYNQDAYLPVVKHIRQCIDQC